MILEIEIFTDDHPEKHRAQGRYLVRGHDDVLWTDDINEAVEYLRACMEQIKA